MILERHTHSDSARHPTRHLIDGVPVSMDAYWDAYDAHAARSPMRGVARSTVDRDMPGGHRARIVTTTLN